MSAGKNIRVIRVISGQEKTSMHHPWQKQGNLGKGGHQHHSGENRQQKG